MENRYSIYVDGEYICCSERSEARAWEIAAEYGVTPETPLAYCECELGQDG